MSPRDVTATPAARRIDVSAREIAAFSDCGGAGARTPMQSKIWLSACAETLVGDGVLNLVTIEDHGEPIAMAPLIRRREAGGRCESLGVGALGEPADFVFRDESALARLVEVISRERALFDFLRLPACSPTIAAIRSAFRGRAVVRLYDAKSCPRIVIPESAKHTDELLSSSLRSDLRRAQRRAESAGEVTYEICTPRNEEAFLPLYERALAIEAAGWKGARSSALAHNQAQSAFFRRYGILASEAGALRLAFLRIGGVDAAMQYAVEWNGAFWLMKVGYDESFAKCSPGLLLMRRTLAHAVEMRLSSYEFLGTEEAWTRRWTKQAMPTVRVRVYPLGPLGSAVLCRDLLVSLNERVIRRLRDSRERRK